MVNLSAPDCQKNYEEMITEQKRLYSLSWEPVLDNIWSADTDIPTAILMAPGRLADKYCKIIKVRRYVAAAMNKTSVFGSGSGSDQVSPSGSGSRSWREKMTHKK